MGTPAEPTPKERDDRRLLAARIVEAATNDEPDPLIDLPFNDYADAIFGLAQEVVMLATEAGEAVTVTLPAVAPPPEDQ